MKSTNFSNQPPRTRTKNRAKPARDYAMTPSWESLTPPAPRLPPDVVAKSSAKYVEAYEKITGKKL
jgi:phosphoribosylaminoimidazole-succinocarboxamide synthase